MFFAIDLPESSAAVPSSEDPSVQWSYVQEQPIIWQPFLEKDKPLVQPGRTSNTLWQPQLDISRFYPTPEDSTQQPPQQPYACEQPLIPWNPFPIRTKAEFERLDSQLSDDQDKRQQLVSFLLAFH